MAEVLCHGATRHLDKRVFKKRINPILSLGDKEVIERYRFPKEGIFDIIRLVEKDVAPATFRSHAIDATTKTLITLRYLAKGDFYSETADLHGVSRTSVCRIIDSVVKSINGNLHNIHFPTSESELLATKRQFYKIGKIPNVIGAIDGTLIPIKAPSDMDEPVYVCRKGYHALNVQAVVGPDMRFTDVVCKWPGSQHDATVFDSCGLKGHLERINDGWLLGDSGYPLRPYLITPKRHPSNQAENGSRKDLWGSQIKI